MEIITVQNLYKIFGRHPEAALRMLEAGHSKDEIMEKTRQGVGVANASFAVNQGEVLVVKAGERHRSRAEEEALVLMFKAAHLFAE